MSEVVAILRTHLEQMHEALDRCAGYFQATDLAEIYRSGTPSPKTRTNRHTALVTQARDRAADYLDTVEEDEDGISEE